ncbi:MAG: peptide ABC transporter substrate-binding protein [Chloroflexota bacterium]|nr:peptide ABC transporter substrate-binding protein [Chloroflexota bacterium]MDQ5865670.1 peptide ABC transporter substrate-binding protein [Chloroflexota bacterium]
MTLSFRPQAILAGLGLALVMVVLLLAPGASTSAPATQHSDTYVEAMLGAPRFVNPLLATSDTDRDLTHLIYSGLTRVDADGKLVPDMASRWDVSTDARVYTFTLKPGGRWHDNEFFTADDVLFTIEQLRRSDFPGDPMLAAPWKEVKTAAPDRQTVVLTLPRPDATFLQHTTLGILPRHLWGDSKAGPLASAELNRSPVGSGPWQYVRGDAAPVEALGPSDAVEPTPSLLLGGAEGVLLEPNPYVPRGDSSFSRIWFRLYPTFGAALTGFKMGEVHGLGHIPPEQLAEVEAVDGVQLHRQNLARYTMLMFNVRSPLFDRTETRQAFELAIDRNALVRDSLMGLGEPLASPVLPHSWAFDSTLQGRGAYDPAKARQLLDTAGWKLGADGIRARDGVTLTVVLAANADVPANVAVAQQLSGFLRAVGVDVKLAPVSREVLLRDYLGPRAFHMAVVGWEADGADPDIWRYWHSSQANVTGGINFSGWSNPEADKALDAARVTPYQSERALNYVTVQKAFATDVPAVVLYTPLYVYATRAPATGVHLPSADLLNPAQRFDTIGDWSLQP